MTTSRQPGEDLLQVLVRQCMEDSQRWFPDVHNPSRQMVENFIHHTLGMFGEVGEFANVVKKVERGDRVLEEAVTQFELRDELTDVFIYLLNLVGLLDFDLVEAYLNKRERNEKRFGPKARMQSEPI